MKFILLNQVFYVLILSFVLVVEGCSSGSSSGPAPATDTTSTESCFDVTIAFSGVSNTSSVCVTDENNRVNGLGVYRFIRFNVASTRAVTFTVTRTSGLEPADPDIVIFKSGVLAGLSLSTNRNSETLSIVLTAGDYVLQVHEDKYTLDNSKQSESVLKQSISNVASKSYQQNSFFAAGPNCTSGSNVTLSGVVTYDLVPHNINNGLDYGNTNVEPVKNAVVELICEDEILLTTNTDNNGNYSFLAPSNIPNVYVRVKAQMYTTGTPEYNFSIVDNTQSQSLYAMDSAAFNVLSIDITDKNLHAQSGWSIANTAYTSTRVAAPFAILDSVLVAMNKILEVSPLQVFPDLNINWSVNNTTATGDRTAGQITSSHYDGFDIYILGAENNDTDEYDDHVIIHEWGHYFEHKFSRSDSIGGSHTGGDVLDIRVAFSEGFGNAYSAIASDDVTYRDSGGVSQASGFGFNIENNNCTNAGWYSECSVQSIIYDLYDAVNDDGVGLGFTPIYNVLIDEQKNTIALTSIFSFIKPLKDENAAQSNGIDALLSGQNIEVITDIYGDSELTNNPGSTNQLPIFTQM